MRCSDSPNREVHETKHFSKHILASHVIFTGVDSRYSPCSPGLWFRPDGAPSAGVMNAGVPQLSRVGGEHGEHHSELVLWRGALNAHTQLPLPNWGRWHSIVKQV